MKKVIWENKYELGGGLGSWAQSRENGIETGHVRFIKGMLMYAYSVYERKYSKNIVNWCPVKKDVTWADMNQWVNSNE